jgi:hypothetical protein
LLRNTPCQVDADETAAAGVRSTNAAIIHDAIVALRIWLFPGKTHDNDELYRARLANSRGIGV